MTLPERPAFPEEHLASRLSAPTTADTPPTGPPSDGCSASVIEICEKLGDTELPRKLRAWQESGCAPLCGASKAYGRFDKPWKHEPECPVRKAWEPEHFGTDDMGMGDDREMFP